MKSLYKKLIEYHQTEYYPMHMPGHKRNTNMLYMDNIYGIDITEIDGFDNLYDADGIIKDAMDRTARVYQSEHTHFLVNGSTVGILVGIATCTRKGDKILVARNCHKAVYNAIFLNELEPIYVYPQTEEEFGVGGGILPENIEELLIKNPDIKLVVITSPTYEGIVSDIEKIVKISHKHHIPCLVDEAHGAHFGFHQQFPKSSIEKGADIVIHSLHKTLPSFTQTALIHINHNLVDYNKIKEYLSIYQSSSPSYILMAGIDRCIELLELQGTKLFSEFYVRLVDFYKSMENLEHIHIYTMKKESNKNINNISDGIYDFDLSKIVISVKNTNISGKQLYDILLKKYKIQLEMASKDYILAMTSICDTDLGFTRLKDALISIDKELSYNQNNKEVIKKVPLKAMLTSYETYYKESEKIPFIDSVGRISKEYIYLYPPGIPSIVPGEVISEKFIENMIEYRNLGFLMKGFADKELEYIKVVK